MTVRSVVPCNGCTACCRNDLIMLHPELGDDPTTYDCQPFRNPISGKESYALNRKPSGACVYLGETGCTIHGRAPVICREFDCRRFYLGLGTRRDRRVALSKSYVTKEVLKAGRDRLNTLPKSALQEAGKNGEGG